MPVYTMGIIIESLLQTNFGNLDCLFILLFSLISERQMVWKCHMYNVIYVGVDFKMRNTTASEQS